MITVYAEKFDVGAQLAAALSGFDVNGTHVTTDNLKKVVDKIKAPCKKKGYIEISYKGEDYAITWGQGHMYGLYQAKDYDPEYAKWASLPIPYFPEEFKLKIREGKDPKTQKSTGKPDVWTERQLAVVKSLFESSDYVISATDDDREGQLIFAYVYEMLDVSVPYKRLSISSNTEQGIKDAFEDLKDSSEVQCIETAGRGRNLADWIVGANLTAAATLKFGSGQLLSLGRVQTPTLAILVKRELEIKNFKSHPFWNINAEFETESGEKYQAKYEKQQIEDKNEANNLLKTLEASPEGVIESCKSENVEKEVPLLYNLTLLSMDSNEQFGFTAQETLDIAQELYMAGYLTYPRTSSQHLTDDMREQVDEILDVLSEFPEYKPLIDAVPKDKRNYTKRHFNSKHVNSHFAIIPTNSKPSSLTDKQKKIYDLCARSLIRIIYKPASIKKTTIITDVNGHKFKSNGSVIVDAQWLAVNTQNSSDAVLPSVNSGDSVTGAFSIKEGKTEPPKRYTDKTLLGVLRTAGKEVEDEELRKIMIDKCEGGIGTEATRGSIIETVVNRYCTRKGKTIIPTEAGIKLIEILPVEDLKSPVMTAKFEDMLNDIANGEMELDSFVDNIKQQTRKWCSEIQSSTSAKISSGASSDVECSCPKCGQPMKKYKWGWCCSNFSKDPNKEGACRFAVSYTISGATLTDKDIKSLIEDKRTRYINGFHKKDSDDTYSAFLILKEDSTIGFSWSLPYNCPVCGKPLTVSSKAWGCSGYKDGCTFTIWNTIAGKKLTDKDKADLLTKKKTKLLNGFTSKSGKSFDAYLVLKDSKIEFEFPERKQGKK